MSELPVTPEGHILLLIKIGENKTFKDYSNIYNCLENVVGMYEDYRAKFQTERSGDLKDFQLWLESFDELDCFQYSREVNRYKHVPKKDFKNLFDSNEANEENEKSTTINETSDSNVANVFSNGATADTQGWVPKTNATPLAITNGTTSQADEDEDQLDYDEEAWDG